MRPPAFLPPELDMGFNNDFSGVDAVMDSKVPAI
jgi:hypothetical protein